MKFDRLQEFVTRVRRMARMRGCTMCKRHTEVGLKGHPRLYALTRQGDLEAIKKGIRERGWFCRKCVRRMEGTTAAATLKDQFHTHTPEGKAAWHRHLYQTKPPPGFEYDPDSPPLEPRLREIATA
jgi:hypothetical protein